MSEVLEDAHLVALQQEAEKVFEQEMVGRSAGRPSTAALAYWHMAQTCQRFLSLPHQP